MPAPDGRDNSVAAARKIITGIYCRAALLARDVIGPRDAMLSPRERQCLSLKARGADDGDIAIGSNTNWLTRVAEGLIVVCDSTTFRAR